MKLVDTIARVQRAFCVQGWSMREIVRQQFMLRKILQTDETDFS